MTDQASQTVPGSGPVQDIVSRLVDTAQRERVTLGDVVEAFGRKSFLPMLMVPALLVVSPLSGVPLLSAACGITIALIAAQMLWPGRDCLWLPGRLTRQSVSGERAHAALQRLASIAHWLDQHTRERVHLLVAHRPGRRFLEACCLLAGATMPFFEVVPFSSSILGFGVLLIVTGLLTRDGIYAVGGIAVLTAAPLVAFFVVSNVLGSG